MARITWAPSALNDLHSLLEFVARDAPIAAIRLVDRMEERVDLLAEYPLLGDLVEEDSQCRYRQLVQVSHHLSSGDEVVYIVAIHHASRLLDVDPLGNV